ncbi:hypothetical protein PFISCL1PPCAC_11209, partial [Pristionchus fissidentatus]
MLSVIFAITHMLTQPFFTAFNGMGLSFAASFIHESIYTQYIMNFVMSPCYIALLECGAFNFLYKYAATCNKSLYHRFDSHLFVFFLFSIAALWLLLYTYFGAVFFAPTTAFREKNQEEGIGPVIALFNFLSLIFCCLGTMIWCGWKIQRMIVTNKLSERAKKVHKQALRLLVLQTSNPIFFVVFPVMLPLMLVNIGVSMPDYFSWFNAYSLLLFPLLNPIIFVICTKDYRRFAIAFAVLSIIFASCHLLTQPYEAIFDSVGLSFAGSFLHDSPAVWYLMSFGVSPCYIALLECGAFSFFYKYAATCNKPLYARFNDPFFVGGLSAVAALWLGLYTYFGVFFAPTQALREKVAIALNDRFQTDFRNLDVHISGIDINE